MARYAIGDIQGCYDDLRALLDTLHFDPEKDRLWLVGDLVNRGPNSLEVLRFVKNLGKRAISVLGNHDLHLLALSQGNRRHYNNTSLDAILKAPDRDELIDWLRRRPLMYRHKKTGFNLIHAGLPPQWDARTARARAKEVEAVLRGPEFSDFCQQMYGNDPDQWSDDLKGMERLRFITNCFTRLRYCDPKGRLGLREKGAPNGRNNGFMPWFRVPDRASRDDKIIFGHWSTLGYLHEGNVWAIDTGCVWGGQLTALRVRRKKGLKPFRHPCAGALKPGQE